MLPDIVFEIIIDVVLIKIDHENRPVESNNTIQPRRMLLLYLTAKHAMQTI